MPVHQESGRDTHFLIRQSDRVDQGLNSRSNICWRSWEIACKVDNFTSFTHYVRDTADHLGLRWFRSHVADRQIIRDYCTRCGDCG